MAEQSADPKRSVLRNIGVGIGGAYLGYAALFVLQFFGLAFTRGWDFNSVIGESSYWVSELVMLPVPAVVGTVVGLTAEAMGKGMKAMRKSDDPTTSLIADVTAQKMGGKTQVDLRLMLGASLATFAISVPCQMCAIFITGMPK